MSTSGRAEFRKATKEELAQAADYRCVRPGCARKTHVFNRATGVYRHFGAAAHDAAASRNGPRPAPEMTEEQRRAYENGAWLCMNCATIVDVLPDWFPPGVISGWQAKAEEEANAESVAPMPPHFLNFADAAIRAKAFCDRVDMIPISAWGSGYVTEVTSDARSKYGSLIGACGNLKSPLNPLSGLYPHVIALQMRIYGNLISIRRFFEQLRGPGWWFDADASWKRNIATNASPMLDPVSQFWSDTLRAKSELIEFHQGRSDSRALFLW
ncbi:hypothetical protein IST4116A_05126 [Burkholderia cenocepacia]|uniref:hypothetical protein n=1 Tax=Burkholderia cenocepacia TaxID=95486 RepID=UPI00114CD349|nr:hypothetical protein [Burkholderia cenocepacia]CAB5154633.1 hypothetical protein IST439_05144 [Burkholderia cenocepacia]CAB5157532.1 hypothetical protein IST4129_05158 [Burkholderia cenocepacia]CAB5165731.1 hypothetical protein IST4116A_05126 [Burkholderia cenocepacia]CAB5166063.1 hypothetical protein IST4113_05157 [Burkholderia cenocepacia]CAB5166367.1 hypothetical protein IST4112_05151 [Burkholderia cenocepacia]